MYNGDSVAAALGTFSYTVPEVASERKMGVEESRAAPELLGMYPSLINASFPLVTSQVYGH